MDRSNLYFHLSLLWMAVLAVGLITGVVVLTQ
jgi:hypothetical protein